MIRKTTPRSTRRRSWRRRPLDAAEDAEAAVNGDDDAGDEAGAGTAQPEQRADQLVWLAEAAGGGVVGDLASPLGELSLGREEECAVLLADEEAGRDGVDAQSLAELARHLDRHPLGEALNSGLAGRVANDARDDALRGHGRNVDDDAAGRGGRTAAGRNARSSHRFTEDETGTDGAGEIELEDLLEGGDLEVEDGLVVGDGRGGDVAAGGVDEDVDASPAIQ